MIVPTPDIVVRRGLFSLGISEAYKTDQLSWYSVSNEAGVLAPISFSLREMCVARHATTKLIVRFPIR